MNRGITAAGAVLLLTAGCASAHTRTPAATPPTTAAAVALPSDGWTPDQPAMEASQMGSITIRGGCATGSGPTLWPTGWTVRGTELLDPTGRVVAHDGQHVRMQGGYITAPADASCGVVAGAQVWAVEGNVS